MGQTYVSFLVLFRLLLLGTIIPLSARETTMLPRTTAKMRMMLRARNPGLRKSDAVKRKPSCSFSLHLPPHGVASGS